MHVCVISGLSYHCIYCVYPLSKKLSYCYILTVSRWDEDHLWPQSELALHCGWLAAGINHMDPAQWCCFGQTSNYWPNIFLSQWYAPPQADGYL